MSLRHDYHAMGGHGTVVKFKRKGGFRSGITLGEAMSDAHLSSNDYYSLYDLNADARGRIILKIRVRALPFFSQHRHLLMDATVDRVQLYDVRAPRGQLRRPRRAPDPREAHRTCVRALHPGAHPPRPLATAPSR